MSLSAYELQRLDNIKRNQRVLESLGLLDTKLIPEPPKHKQRPPRLPKFDATFHRATFPQVASRRSDRVGKTPAFYAGLTDQYFRSEQSGSDSDDDYPRVKRSSLPRRNPRRKQELQCDVQKSPRVGMSRKTPVMRPHIAQPANMPAFTAPSPMPYTVSNRKCGTIDFSMNGKHVRREYAAGHPRHGEIDFFEDGKQVRAEFDTPHPRRGMICFIEDGTHVRTEYAPTHPLHGEIRLVEDGKLVRAEYAPTHPLHGEIRVVEDGRHVRTEYAPAHPLHGEIRSVLAAPVHTAFAPHPSVAR